MAHLDLHHMDGVPAALDLLCVPSLLNEDHACKAMVQVPQVHRTHAALKIAVRGGREGGNFIICTTQQYCTPSHIPHPHTLTVLDMCRRLDWPLSPIFVVCRSAQLHLVEEGRTCYSMEIWRKMKQNPLSTSITAAVLDLTCTLAISSTDYSDESTLRALLYTLTQ